MQKGRIGTIIGTLAVTSLAAAFVVTQGPTRSSPAELARGAVSEVTTLAELPSGTSRAKSGAASGRHLGFDTYSYPGDEVMQAWLAEGVPYEWVGYYLPAPCHKGDTWVGKRERLATMGWGMAVIYVGQQTWDRTPRAYETKYRLVKKRVMVKKRVRTRVVRNGKRVTRYVTKRVPVTKTVSVPYRVKVDPTDRPLDQCNANLVNGTRGRIEGDDAIRRTAAEGFPRGSVIFLDIERMEKTPQAMRDYYRAWTARVLEDGRYRPGYYAHKHNAQRIYDDVKLEFLAAGKTDEPPFWIAGGRDFSPQKAPHEVGHQFASVWQGVLDVVQEWEGFKLPLDVNVAAVPDPSHQYVNAD
ncbi:MAG TPA: glycoside hydrolase domain-containing protein [Gemmatimonadaceae bacterium]|nr:glycoside hydrolase domain-containing protein [Gemmatimonadaceae bacterium]